MQFVHMSQEPYEAVLFCPYCGQQILCPEWENIGDCGHLVHADIEKPESESTDTFSGKRGEHTGVCFVLSEMAPASRDHFIAFREV